MSTGRIILSPPGWELGLIIITWPIIMRMSCHHRTRLQLNALPLCAQNFLEHLDLVLVLGKTKRAAAQELVIVVSHLALCLQQFGLPIHEVFHPLLILTCSPLQVDSFVWNAVILGPIH